MGMLFGGKKKTSNPPPIKDYAAEQAKKAASDAAEKAKIDAETRKRRASLASNVIFGGTKDSGKSSTLGG